MSKTVRWLFPAVVLVTVALGWTFCNSIYGAGTAPAQAPAEDAFKISVVDLPKLVAAHPDVKKLDELDRLIASLAGQMEGNGIGMKDATEQAYRELEKIHKKLMSDFEADMNRVKGDLDRKKAVVESTLQADAENMKREMKAFQDGLQGKYSGPAPANGDLTKKFDAKMSSYVKDLIIVRDSNYAARKLEIQRRMDANLSDEKKKLDAQLAQRMGEVMKANQHEKLQLQLDIQTASNEEQRKKLQERLASLTGQEEDKRDAIRKELSRSYESARQKEMAHGQTELKAYAQKLNDDMNHQIGHAKGATIKEVTGGYTPPDAKKLTAQAEAKLNELKGRFESHKNALVGGLKQDSEAAQAYLGQRQKQLQKELDDAKKRILKQVENSNEKLSAEEKKRQDHLKAELDSLKKQREKVYDSIVDQIRQGVDQLAHEQKVPLVVGGYRVNVNCNDLTELALQRVIKK